MKGFEGAMRLGAPDAECIVFTFKEGLLSRAAHDLKLRAERLEVELDPAAGRVRAEIDAASLRVVCAMRGGEEDRGALSERDRRDVEANLAKEVLEVARHPSIRFESTSVAAAPGGYRIAGRLSLHGREREIAFDARREAGRLVAEVRLHQPDFGVRPFSAMMGTLRVKADVVVRLSLPDLGG